MADTVQNSILDILKSSSADLFDGLVSLTNESPEELVAKVAKANKDERLKVETCRHHAAFADLCLEILLLGEHEVFMDMFKRHHVVQDSPYLMFLSKYDYEDENGFYYLSPERHQVEYFASHGVVKYLASQTIPENQKKGVLLALTSNLCMREVVELTFELIAADLEIKVYLQDMLRATLILQIPKGASATDAVTTRLLGLEQNVENVKLSNLLNNRQLHQAEIQLIEDIWAEINAAFTEDAEDLQEAGWFVDLHRFDYSFTSSAESCSSERTKRHSSVLGHILRCLRLLDADTRDALFRTTIHRLLPSYSRLSEDEFTGAYRIGDHSWGLFLRTSQYLCLQTLYPDDMPAALKEHYSDEYQAINLDLRSLIMHEESHSQNLKWVFKRCWEFLNQHCTGSSKGALKGLTLTVNAGTQLKGLIDQLSLIDDKNDITITFIGGVLHLKEVKDSLSRQKMLQFQRITVKIPDELNKGFVEKGLYRWYPNAVKCVQILHESEKSSIKELPPSKNLLGGLRDGSSSLLNDDLPADVKFKPNGQDVRERGTLHECRAPNSRAKHRAPSAMQEAKKSLKESLNVAQGSTKSILMDHQGTGSQIGRGSDGRSDQIYTGIVKTPESSAANLNMMKRRYARLDDFDDSDDFKYFEMQGRTERTLRIAHSILQGDLQDQPLDLDANKETDSAAHRMTIVQPSIPVQSGSNSMEQVAKGLSTIGDECKLMQGNADMNSSLTGQELICHIGNGLRKVGDILWKGVLTCQNTGVRFRYTVTVAVLTWGFLSNCTHLDVVSGLVFRGQLIPFKTQ